MKKLTKCTAVAMSMALLITGLGASPVEAAKKSSKKVAISKKTLKLTEGKTATLKVNNLSKAKKKKLKWSSNKKSVAKVDKKGKVTAKKAGTAKITAKVGKQKYTCKVTVVKKQKPKTPAQLAAEDRANLQKFVNKLKADGAQYGTSVDSRNYQWNDAGRLIGIDLGDDEGGDLGFKGVIDTSCFSELETLSVEGNRGVTALNISGNKKLKKLYCDITGITKLDVSNNTALERLYCEDTKIKTLDVSALGKKGEVIVWVPKGTKVTGANANVKITYRESYYN